MNPMLQIKRVYDPPAPEDGLRVLCTKRWPRGIKRTAVDHWWLSDELRVLVDGAEVFTGAQRFQGFADRRSRGYIEGRPPHRYARRPRQAHAYGAAHSPGAVRMGPHARPLGERAPASARRLLDPRRRILPGSYEKETPAEIETRAREYVAAVRAARG